MQLLIKFLILFLHLCFLSLQIVKGTEDETRKKTIPEGLKELLSKAKPGLKDSWDKMRTIDTHSFEDLGLTPPPLDANDTIVEDHHTYYNSTSVFSPEAAKAFWVDLDKIPQEQVINHAMLSDSHRQATTVTLSFGFPFYGSVVRNITIATGGFLYTGDYLHSWIAATQYVAPLMANFDTRLSDDSTIKYADNGTAFIVQWDKVHIQGRADDGAFTFQVTLLKKGDIIFAYKDIPYAFSNISDDEHPVKVGISDAYIIEKRVFFLRRKTIYEYHRIDLLEKRVSNNTAIYFTALPTCLDYHTCEECLGTTEVSECSWCEAVQRCSDGVDRQRQSWLTNKCTLEAHGETCPGTTNNESISIVNTSSSVNLPPYFTRQRTTLTSGVSETTSVTSGFKPSYFNISSNNSAYNQIQGESAAAAYSQVEIKKSESVQSVNPAIVVTIVGILAGLAGLAFWVIYAYKFPHSSSGQFLIKYRPSQWKVNKEECSTTSPSLHM